MQKRTFTHIVLWSVIAAAVSVQLLIVVAFIFSFIPIKPSPLLQELFLRHQPLVMPEREMFFFRFFVLTACALQAGGLFVLRKHLSDAKLTPALAHLAAAELCWTFLLVFAVFKIFVYGNPSWARSMLYAAFAAAFLSKIFWSEISKIPAQFSRVKISARAADIVVPCVIALIIFIPDLNGLLAKMFMTDHFHHFDTMLTSPAWAYVKGSVLDVDQFTHYAVGMPVVLARLAQALGGFSYQTLVGVLMAGTIAYYIAGYFFMRAWLGSAVVAACTILMTIKWQMFHPGVAPVIFNYPSATVMRFPLDILLFFLILWHIRRGQAKYLIWSAVICGFSMFYMIDTGVYMSAAFGAYLLWFFLRRGSRKSALAVAGYILLTAFTALLCLGSTQGKFLFSPVFWTNMAERTGLFLAGHGNLPMYKSLLDGKYLECLVGFVIPLMYTVVLIATAALIWFKKIDDKHIMIAVLCVYGLASYHYYIVRSADTSYYVVAWPSVFIRGFVLYTVANLFRKQRRLILSAASVLVVFSLTTNHYFLNYPNLLHLSRNPFTHPFVMMKLEDGRSFFNHNDVVWPPQLKLPANSLGETEEGLKTEADFETDAAFKEYFSKEFDFSDDARLIAGLTTPDEAVPLISSFETRILMQADRKPFFYYFPLVDSRPMRMRMFDMTALWTKGRLQKTMDELQTRAPQYIFMEKILLTDKVPAQYEYLYPDLLVVLNYIHQHYGPSREGRYLIAMKRR